MANGSLKRIGQLVLLLICMPLSVIYLAELWADEPVGSLWLAQNIEALDSAEKPELSVQKLEDEEDFYELLKLFADTLDQVERNYVQEVSRRELMEAAIQGVLAKLDQYSDYIPPDEFESFRTGVENEYGGIGIRVGMDEGQLLVITPIVGSPAYKAGIMAGDKIIKISDQSTDGMDLQGAIKLMKGRIGTPLDLTVKHRDSGEEVTVRVTRELIQMETVFGIARQEKGQWRFMLDPDNGLGYIRLSSFSRDTHRELRKALKNLTEQDLNGLVLDLRFNPGGLLSSAIEVADLFLSEGVIVSTEGRNIEKRSWSAESSGTFDDFELVVLVNRYSASASEIVAASLQDHQRAIVVGERTWGKGSVQNIIELEGGRSALKLTTAGYQRPSGKNIHRIKGAGDADDWGVRPDDGFQLRLTPPEVRQLLQWQRESDIVGEEVDPAEAIQNDRHLQKAIEYLTE